MVALSSWASVFIVMSKWEYNSFEWSDNLFSNMQMLEKAGSSGWELIQIFDGKAILKKKATGEKKPTIEVQQDITIFESAWHHYRRKGSKKKSLEQWNKLSNEEQEQALSHIQAYVESVSDVKYQKDFERYLRDKCFLNVVYKDGRTIFDTETNDEPQKDDKLIVNGVIYR